MSTLKKKLTKGWNRTTGKLTGKARAEAAMKRYEALSGSRTTRTVRNRPAGGGLVNFTEEKEEY